MQGVMLKCTRHECSVFVNLRPHLLRTCMLYVCTYMRINSKAMELCKFTSSFSLATTVAHPYLTDRYYIRTCMYECTVYMCACTYEK